MSILYVMGFLLVCSSSLTSSLSMHLSKLPPDRTGSRLLEQRNYGLSPKIYVSDPCALKCFQKNFLCCFSRCKRKTYYPITLPFFKYQCRFGVFSLLLGTLANLHAVPNGRLSVSPAGSWHHHMHQICQVFHCLQTISCQCLSSLNSSDIKPWETLLGED